MTPAISYAIFGGILLNFVSLAELYKIPKAERPDFKVFCTGCHSLCGPSQAAYLRLCIQIPGSNLNPYWRSTSDSQRR